MSPLSAGPAPQDAVERDDGWRAFGVSGTLGLSLVGTLRAVSMVSTYGTEYVLVKGEIPDSTLTRCPPRLRRRTVMYPGEAD